MMASAVSPPVSNSSVELLGTRLDYATVPIVLGIDLPPLGIQQAARPATRGPLPIGVHRNVPNPFRGDVAPQLTWTQLTDGTIVTSISLSSPSAVSVRIGVVAELPEGGEIRLFDPTDPGRRFPAVTVDDFIGEREGDPEVIWLPAIEGEVVGIEVTLPSWEAKESLSLVLEKIAHRYATVSSPYLFPKNLECAGYHIDVQCRTGTFPRGQENAVGLITFEKDGESRVCSGTLLNSSSGNFEPYFLTANHCVSTYSVARTVEVFWFFQRRSCDSSVMDDIRRTTGGADLLATSVEQDSTLLLLRENLPDGLWYSGWNNRRIGHPSSVYNISHPDSGVKKYAAGWTTQTTDIPVDDFVLRNGYEVEWSEGSTEGGSSGSGLFYGAEGYLIGVLSGKLEGCGRGSVGYFGSFSDFYPRISRWISPDTSAAPDLVVGSLSVDDASLRLGQRFQVSVTVRNQGDGRSAATTLRYYRSSDSRISSVDAEVGTDYVRALEARGRSAESVSLSAPNATGTWYYGACIDRVSGESNVDNNCSTGVRITVTGDTQRKASQAARLGDFDGNRRADVLLRHASGRWYFYPMYGRHHTAGRGTANLTRNRDWAVAGIGDLNGDSRDDVLLRKPATGTWYYYPMNGRRHLAGHGAANLTSDLAWSLAGIGDFDGNGRDDVLLRHANGRWHFYPMNGRRYAAGQGRANLTRNLAWSVAGIGDLNGDGRDDVLLRKPATGTWYYYPMNGRRHLAGHGAANLTSDLAWSLAGIGDFDGNGRDDVLLRHESGRWYFYPMYGRHHTVGRGTANLTRNRDWSVAGIGDLNGDGRDDVLLRKPATGTWYYYPMNGRRYLIGHGAANLTSNLAWYLAAGDGSSSSPMLETIDDQTLDASDSIQIDATEPLPDLSEELILE